MDPTCLRAKWRNDARGARLGVARLSGWQFMINQIGAAALRPNPDAEVYGVLWRCHARHMADLDRYEAVAQRVYFRDPHRVQLLPLMCR